MGGVPLGLPPPTHRPVPFTAVQMTAVIRVYGNVVETHEHEAILRNGELLISHELYGG